MLSIVIGTLDRLDQLRRAVDSIVSETRVPFRLYVTDAGSTDGTVEYLRSIASDIIRPIFRGRKLGQAKAYNDVFWQIDTKYCCWLSDDNVVIKHGLDRAVDILESEPRIGMVGLKVKDLRGPFVDAPYVGGVSTYGILNVNQGVLRTEILHRVGCFSEEFRDYGIDPDLTAKVLLAGHHVVLTRDIAIHHYRNWETDRSSPAFGAMMERQRQSLELYRTKYAGRIPDSRMWNLKRLLWKVLRRLMRLNADTQREFLGLNGRDWYNCFSSRFIRIGRELLWRNDKWHLRQYLSD